MLFVIRYFSLKNILDLCRYLVPAFFSYYITSSYYQNKLNEIDEFAYEQNEQSQQVNFDRLLDIQNAQTNLMFTEKQVDNEYRLAIDSIDFNKFNGMYNSNGEGTMSEGADTTSTVSKKRSKCCSVDSSKLQRLYERQLVIARDCDITANYYNELLNLYHSLENK